MAGFASAGSRRFRHGFAPVIVGGAEFAVPGPGQGLEDPQRLRVGGPPQDRAPRAPPGFRRRNHAEQQQENLPGTFLFATRHAQSHGRGTQLALDQVANVDVARLGFSVGAPAELLVKYRDQQHGKQLAEGDLVVLLAATVHRFQQPLQQLPALLVVAVPIRKLRQDHVEHTRRAQ